MGFVFSFPKLYHLINKNKPSREQQPLIHMQEQQYKTMFIKADMKFMIARILLFTIQRNLSRSNCFMDMLPSSLPSPLLFLPTSPCVCVCVLLLFTQHDAISTFLYPASYCMWSNKTTTCEHSFLPSWHDSQDTQHDGQITQARLLHSAYFLCVPLLYSECLWEWSVVIRQA